MSTHRMPLRNLFQVSALAAGLLCASGAAAEELTDKDLTVEQSTVYQVQPAAATSAAGLKVTAWVDQNDNTYTVGEHVRLFVQANQDSYITVLNVGPSGQTTVLFPNKFQSDNKVAANKAIEVPAPASGAKITVGGPVGSELIKVIATTQPVQVIALEKMSKGDVFKSVDGGATAAAKDLQVAASAAPTAGYQIDTFNKVIKTTAAEAGTNAVVLVQTPEATTQPAATQPAATEAAAATPAQPFGLRLATDKPQYKIGEPIAIAVTPDETCHLTLLNLGASGQTRVLFPNQAIQNNLVQAKQTVLLPGLAANVTIQALGPAGTETLVAVCSKENKPILSTAFNFADFFPKAGPAETVTRDLGVVSTQPAGSVAQAKVTFTVQP